MQIYGINPKHLAKIVKCTDKVGELSKKAADELELEPGTAVFGGGGDASLIGVGAGSVDLGDTHVYSGTSGWVSTVVDKSVVDTSAMIAAIVGARDGYYNYLQSLRLPQSALSGLRTTWLSTKSTYTSTRAKI